MRPPLFLATLLAPLALHAADEPKLSLLAEVKGFASPESVASDGSHYLVSNVGKELKPTEKDGDGFISRMDLKGQNLELRFIEGLNAPKGLLALGGTLYVCDVDVLLGFNLTTKEKTLEISFANNGVTFLNDVCAGPKGTLFVSATDKNAIYKVDLKEKSAKPIEFDKSPNGPNGLAFFEAEQSDKIQMVVVAEWGTDGKANGVIRAYRLDDELLLGTEDVPGDDFPIKPGLKDGLAFVVPDKSSGVDSPFCLHSDWVAAKPGGKLLLLLMQGLRSFDLAIPSGPVAGPADFFYEPKTGTVALPCMLEGRVLLLSLKLPKP
jgi:hypothetical protein